MDNINEQQEESFFNIDFKKLFSDVLHLWWLFVIAIVVALIVVHIYHKYTAPVYRSELTLIIDQDATSQSNVSSQQNMIDGFMLTPGMRNIDNQIAILGSRTMISRIVEGMGIYTTYFHKGHVVDTEMYPSSPFVVDMDSTHVQPLNVNVYLTFIDSLSFKLIIKSDNVVLYDYSTRSAVKAIENIAFEQKYNFGEPIITDWCAFTINLQKYAESTDYFFRFELPDNLVNAYRSSLQIIRDEQTNSSVVTLAANGLRPQKTIDFLNHLAYTFINDNLSQKNLIAENTIKFIEEQLVSLSDTLDVIGTRLSSFRATHGLQQSASAKSNALFTELQEYERQIQDQKLYLSYYDYLDSYFSSDTILDGVIAPAMFDTKSAIIAEQLNNIIKLNNEKQAYQDTYGKPINPASKEILAKLQIARSTLLKSVASHKKMVHDNICELEKKEASYKSELMALPETERIYLGIDRKFTLNNDVYNFLLRKRSESQIQKASNTPDHKILDAATTVGQVSPNYKKNRMMALAAAIMLPLILILLRQMLDNKLRTPDDVSKITKDKLPIIGEIPNNTRTTPFVVLKHPKSLSAEAFRRMRSRIEFMIPNNQTKVITVSSSMPGEGKTFCSVNVASVFAINGKKTVLLGFDLRKPSLTELIQDTNREIGLTNYIVGDVQLDDILHNVDVNFDVICAGTIPPNPAELISSQRSTELIEILKQRYDIIIIDTPPMGLVSDAYLISRWSNLVLFISRLDYTLKDALTYTSSTFEGEGVANVGLVINDTNNKKSRYGYGYYGHYGKYGYGRYGRYGYGYGKYGYGDKKSGYYTED